MQVALDNVTLSYGSRAVIEGLSALIKSDHVTALIGPSGSGKSSLLSAIAGYKRLTAGSIEFQDLGAHDASSPDPNQVVWIPQGSNSLPSRSAIDNVAIGALASGRRRDNARLLAQEAIAKVGLGGKEELLARQLSGGELQRLGFARALASGRALVLADEPSSSLDLANIKIVASLLRELSGHATIVVATHDELIMEAADSVVDLRASS